MCGCLSCTRYWGPGPQPRRVPWLEIKPFGSQAGTQSTEPHQPRQNLSNFKQETVSQPVCVYQRFAHLQGVPVIRVAPDSRLTKEPLCSRFPQALFQRSPGAKSGMCSHMWGESSVKLQLFQTDILRSDSCRRWAGMVWGHTLCLEKNDF